MLSTTGTSSQQVGGCLLDKIGAIINENGIVKFANDLKVDLSACCTKGTDAEQAKCVKELSPAYAAIIAKNKAKALKTIVKAASERLKGVTLKPMGAALLAKTKGGGEEEEEMAQYDEEVEEENWD